MLKFSLSCMSFMLWALTLVQAQSASLEEVLAAYTETFGALHRGYNYIALNDSFPPLYEAQAYLPELGYAKLYIQASNTYVELQIFESDYITFVLLVLYREEDFRAKLTDLKCYVYNATPLGNPLEESREALPWEELYQYYYSRYAALEGYAPFSPHRSDVNYLRFHFSKEKGGPLSLQLAKPKVSQGAVVEDMVIEDNGRFSYPNLPPFRTIVRLRFVPESNCFALDRL